MNKKKHLYLISTVSIIFLSGLLWLNLAQSGVLHSLSSYDMDESSLPNRLFIDASDRIESLRQQSNLEKATFAGGCFWCLEGPFESLDGVEEALSGYAGGNEENPTYDQVTQGETGHRESVQVWYNPAKVSYETLLETFFRVIDPTDSEGQFADKGFHYTTAVFYHTDDQEHIAEMYMKKLQESDIFDGPIFTQVLPFTTFFLAEEYHQNFYLKQSQRYKQYANASGRNKYIQRKEEAYDALFTPAYQKPSAEVIESLDPLSYHVIIEGGTEKPFDNEYWNHTADGIYVDKVSGDPLFSSTHKYDSGTGWPSFYKTIRPESVETLPDEKLPIPRTEIRSSASDAHLGHVFSDGPEEHGGNRFCVNSASLRFVPLETMKEEGYEHYLYLFE